MIEACKSFRESIGELVKVGGLTLYEIEQKARWNTINAALEATGGNQCRAAKALHVHRNTLNRHILLMSAAGALTVELRGYRKSPQSVKINRRQQTA